MSSEQHAGALSVGIVRGIDELLSACAIRAMVFAGEQRCPLTEEFDGNDFAGVTHLLVRHGVEPVGTLRMRWFADFAKVERVAVLPSARNNEPARALIRFAVHLAARKGYRRLIGNVEQSLVAYWQRALGVRVREDRPRVRFSDRDYVEIELALVPPIDAITPETEPMVMLRPEGAWDEPGVLDRSAERQRETTWNR